MAVTVTVGAGRGRIEVRGLCRGVCTIREVGIAMIHAASTGAPRQILEVKDIVALAKE